MSEIINYADMAPDTVLAKVVKREDGYHVIDFDGTEGPVCNRRTTDGYIILTPNASNRKCVNEKNADKYFAENPDGCIELVYKASRPAGSCGGANTMPHAKLIKYLPQELQDEYAAIIARAIQAKEADKAKPMTEKEKLEVKLAKLKAKLAELEAEDVE